MKNVFYIIIIVWIGAIFYDVSTSNIKGDISGETRSPFATVVTLNDYNQIAPGITYQEAVTIIGTKGTELARSSVLGFETVIYTWSNPLGSNMNVTFQNNRFVSKAQFGLK